MHLGKFLVLVVSKYGLGDWQMFTTPRHQDLTFPNNKFSFATGMDRFSFSKP
jgi:hypothetical protein